MIDAITHFSLSGLLSLFFLSVVGTVYALGAWAKLLSLYPATIVAPYYLASPYSGCWEEDIFFKKITIPSALVLNTYVSRQVSGTLLMDRSSTYISKGMVGTTLRISSNKQELEIEVIYNFLHEHAAWAQGVSRELMKQAIDGSLCFGAYLETKQVGFARLVTDMATFGYLCDVFVLPELRSKGYASARMKHIFDLEPVKKMRRVVSVTSDAHHVYRPMGFENLSHPEKYMELHRPHIFKK